MIKVNLLREHTGRIKTRKIVVAPTVNRTGIIALVIFLVTAGGLWGWWYYLNNQLVTLKDRRDHLRIENTRLQSLKKQITEYEKAKKQLQGRIDVIEQLQENQSSPVLLLNHVIQSIPRDASLWLTVMDQKGDRVQITGFTPKAESIPDFMTSLTATGFFRTVDLESFEDQKEAAKFTLLCMTKRKGVKE